MIINLNILTNYLGKPVKKSGDECFWQCPYCLDSHRDNLKFNIKKNILYCFANADHAKYILKSIFNAKKDFQGVINYKNIDTTSTQNRHKKDRKVFFNQSEKFLKYMLNCNNNLLNDKKSLMYIYNKRGIDKNTVDFCGIGIDKKKRLWVIPTFKYDLKECVIVGFEYRPPDLGKNGLFREKNTINSMAMINCYTSKTEILVIVEGYFDAYTLFQYLRDNEQSDYYHIVTPSNGVNSLLKYLNQIDFTKYKKIFLFIDNDNVSIPISDIILAKYPFIELIRLTCGCKDFNEHYLRCIKEKC